MIKQLPVTVCDIKFEQPFWGGDILTNPEVGFKTFKLPDNPDTVHIYTDLLCKGESMSSGFKFSFRLVISFELATIDLTEKSYNEALKLTTDYMNSILKAVFAAQEAEIIVALIPSDRYEDIVSSNIESVR